MPCRDDSNSSYYSDRDKIDRLTRMLCGLCAEIEQVSPNTALTMFEKVKGLPTWWRKHQRVDRARIKREQAEKKKKQLMAEALNKLTPEEKRILNIRDVDDIDI